MLRIGLMGCGRVSKRHSELLGLNKIQGAVLAGVCDSDLGRAREVGHCFSVPYYSSVKQLLEKEKIDVVSILTESGNHAKHAVEVASRGKHVIVEKPMALTLSDADQMISACDHAGVKLFVVKQNRFNVPVLKLKKAIDSGRFGKMILGTVRVRWCRPQDYYDQADWRGTWALDGGVLTNQAIHHVDMLEWMMGDVESVFAYSTRALAKIEAEDTVAVTLKFRNGALGVIEATTATRPRDLEGSISVLGEGGTVEIGGFAVNQMKTWSFSEPMPEDDSVMERYSVNPPDVYGYGHKAYYDYVVDCISNGGPHLIDGLVGRKSLELVNAIYESIETGLEVPLSFRPKYCKLGIVN
ncbi:Gfo/Idh/MocA family oxidoreductase [Alphaproteobacteria bacterium]|nr:Gfo/Idh/MocA family oxidoreductase [Alphaproteobacteria bacterium]